MALGFTSRGPEPRSIATQTLFLAIWFGLLTGIGEGVLAVEMAATARDLALIIHPHPTLSETIGAAAETLYGTATDLYRPRKESKKVKSQE